MEKKITILLFIGTILFSSSSKGQISNPYLDSTSTWYELFGASDGVNIYKDHNKYFIDGDTIIYGNSYHKLYIDEIDSVFDFFSYTFLTVNYYSHAYVSGLREDSLKSFYMFLPGATSEILLFDFNLSVGDTLPNMQSNYGCNSPANTVVSIDTVYLGTQVLKKFHFPPGLFNKTMYEGIGSSGGLTWSGSLCTFIESGACLIAYRKGIDSLYINCGLGTTGVSGPVEQTFIHLYPNPSAGFITVEHNYQTQMTFSLFSSVGEEILTNIFPITLKLKTIKTDKLKSGIYFWKMSDAKKITQYGKLVIIK